MNLKLPAKILAISFLVFCSLACHRSFIKLQKAGTTEEKYKAALTYYNKSDYYRASILFEEIIPLLKGDSTAERSQFYNAYCNYYQGQYQLSSYHFKNFYSTYANSSYAEEAFYMYTLSLYKDSPAYNLDQESTLTAIEALQTFLNTFPSSKYAEECTGNLSDLRKRLEKKAYEKALLYYKTSGVTIANYKAAVITIANFQKDFPDSKYNEELAYIQIKSQLELAHNSFFDKQKERYLKTLELYDAFVDNYPQSEYSNELSKLDEEARKSLSKVIKQQEELDKEKAKALEKKSNSLMGKSLPISKQSLKKS